VRQKRFANTPKVVGMAMRLQTVALHKQGQFVGASRFLTTD
jgi:hypothetical protein